MLLNSLFKRDINEKLISASTYYTITTMFASKVNLCLSKLRITFPNPKLVAQLHLSFGFKYCAEGSSVNLSYHMYEPQHSPPEIKSPLIILHGLLGSKQNWRSLAKVIANKSRRKVYALDARNHGDSPHTNDFNYPLMGLDVKHFMKSTNIPAAVVMGHSMGGRTAMLLAINEPSLVEKLIVVDVSPCAMLESGSSVIPGYFKAMQEITKIITIGTPIAHARKLAEQHLSQTIPEKGICQFLLTNLAEDKDHNFQWKANIDVLEKTFESGVNNFPTPQGTYSGETLFICGGNSFYVRPDDEAFIVNIFPKANFIRIPGAGHWVHSEKPAEFLQAIERVL